MIWILVFVMNLQILLLLMQDYQMLLNKVVCGYIMQMQFMPKKNKKFYVGVVNKNQLLLLLMKKKRKKKFQILLKNQKNKIQKNVEVNTTTSTTDQVINGEQKPTKQAPPATKTWFAVK
eukprot:UN02157